MATPFDAAAAAVVAAVSCGGAADDVVVVVLVASGRVGDEAADGLAWVDCLLLCDGLTWRWCGGRGGLSRSSTRGRAATAALATTPMAAAAAGKCRTEPEVSNVTIIRIFLRGKRHS